MKISFFGSCLFTIHQRVDCDVKKECFGCRIGAAFGVKGNGRKLTFALEKATFIEVH